MAALPTRPSIELIPTTPGPVDALPSTAAAIAATRNGSSSAWTTNGNAGRLTSTTRRQFSSGSDPSGSGLTAPAAWTNASSPPSGAPDRDTAAATAGGSVTSTATPTAQAPSSATELREWATSTTSELRSHSATERPSARRTSAVARPIPDAPPVMTTPDMSASWTWDGTGPDLSTMSPTGRHGHDPGGSHAQPARRRSVRHARRPDRRRAPRREHPDADAVDAAHDRRRRPHPRRAAPRRAVPQRGAGIHVRGGQGRGPRPGTRGDQGLPRPGLSGTRAAERGARPRDDGV